MRTNYRNGPRTPHFPSAPLAALIRQRALYDGLDAVAAIVAARLDRSAASMQRAAWRILTDATITLKTLDEWCVALAGHPTMVYGREYENDIVFIDELSEVS